MDESNHTAAPRQTLKRWTFILANGLAFAVFLLYVYPYSKPFPYSDDWILVSHVLTNLTSNFQWLFELHNDHRIPLQKLLHVFLLGITSIDFRALILANAAFALITSLVVEAAGVAYRKRRDFSDVLIPLIIFNLGFNYFAWAFSFQFLSSDFLLAVIIYCLVRYEIIRANRFLYGGLIAVLFCSLCGMNGLIVASTMLVSILFYLIFQLVRRKDRSLRGPLALAACIAIAVVTLWSTWKPSAASLAGKSTIQAFMYFLVSMFKAHFVIFAMHDGWWKACLLAAIVGLGLFVSLKRIYREWALERRFSLAELALLSALVAVMGTILSVTFGRFRYQPWTPGLELHYGGLTVLMPIIAWLLISKDPNRIVRWPGTLTLLVLSVLAFNENAQWRINSVNATRDRVAMVDSLIRNPLVDPDLIAKDYILEMNWVDEELYRSWIKGEILKLRNKLDAKRGSASVLDNPLIEDFLSTRRVPSGKETCLGNLDSVSAIQGKQGYVKLSGWIFSPEFGVVPHTLAVTDVEGFVVGYASAGDSRPDVATRVDPRSANSGFAGYLRKDLVGKKVYLVSSAPPCHLEISPLLQP